MEKRASLIFEVFSAAELSSAAAASRLRRSRRLSRDILSMKQTAAVDVGAARFRRMDE